MICPICHKDMSRGDGTLKVVRNPPHDFLPFIRRGVLCGHCKNIIETIEEPKGVYHKKPKDPEQLELLVETIETKRELDREQRTKLKKVKRDIRELYNSTK